MADAGSVGVTNDISYTGLVADVWASKNISQYPVVTVVDDSANGWFREAQNGYVSGTILGSNGSPAQKLVRVYRRDTGAFLCQTLSDPTTGAYSLRTYYAGPVDVLALDASSLIASGGTANALVYDLVTTT